MRRHQRAFLEQSRADLAGRTRVTATHHAASLDPADRVLRLEDGRIEVVSTGRPDAAPAVSRRLA